MFHTTYAAVNSTAPTFEDVCFTDSLTELESAPVPMLGGLVGHDVTQNPTADLDIDLLTSTSGGFQATDWDALVQSESMIPVLANPLDMTAKPTATHISFLQATAPTIQFDTVPEPMFAPMDDVAPPTPPAARPLTSNASGGVVKALLVSEGYAKPKNAHADGNAAGPASSDRDHQDHIVNSLSVAQMVAVASAYDHVCRVEDLDAGCANWLADTPEATDVEIRAVRALFNPERWNIAKDIVMRIVRIVDDLRAASDPSSRTLLLNRHAISKPRRRLSPKAAAMMALHQQRRPPQAAMPSRGIAADVHPFIDDPHGNARRF
ncbi:Uncharacterized protein PBTT_04500 [Plasmodiophora brassicae]